jgi:hypothetical protein
LNVVAEESHKIGKISKKQKIIKDLLYCITVVLQHDFDGFIDQIMEFNLQELIEIALSAEEFSVISSGPKVLG